MLMKALNWLKDNWRWTLLNVFALGLIIHLLNQISVKTMGFGEGGSVFDVTFIDSGHWSIRFLLFSLAITPIYRIFGWRSLIPLRKPAGLWAFAFAMLHFGYNWLIIHNFQPSYLVETPYMLVGFIALAMLTVMAITSNRWAMKWPGRTWKRIHRMVYAVAVLVILHVVLALNGSKKAWFNPIWYREFIVYGVIVAVLLILRVTVIRHFLITVFTLGQVKVKRKRSDASALAAE